MAFHGKSNAFAISKKLGLPEEILEKAKLFLKQDTISIEELLKNIYDDKLVLEKEKQETEKNLAQIENLRKSLEQEKAQDQKNKQDQIEKVKLEAKHILLSAKEQANYTIQELNSLYEKQQQLENINWEEWTDAQIANFVKEHFTKNPLKEANALRKQLNSSFEDFTLSSNKTENKTIEYKKEDLAVGMQVKLRNFSEIATILSLSGKKNQFQVQIGNAKLNATLSAIEEIKKETKKSATSFSANSSFSHLKAKHVPSEINVIGQTVEEACAILDKYLDDCAIAKLSPIRIVHGKGTGKLKNGIHTFLRKHPHVKSFRMGTFGEGEMGVTIVEIQ